jgi:hypothetical protein
VLRQVKDLSPTTASEETIRIVGLFGLAHAPSLESFLQDLEKLQPDLDRYFETGEETPDVDGPPLWATSVQRNTATLMNNVGMQLQLTNALLRVDSLRTITARNEIQQITKTSADLLPPATATSAPSQQYIMTGNGNVYQGIQISGSARVHIGESYSYLGVPKASVDKISEKINELATSNQADALQSLLQQMQKKQSDGCSGLSVLDARTQQVLDQLRQIAQAIATANEAPSLSINAQNKQLRKTTLKRPAASICANMSSILEILRIWLSAMIMTLLMGSRFFQRFIRSARTFAQSPNMLLGSNIMIVDAPRREFSLPYEHFCRWPLMLAHLQCEFKGLPGESHISTNKFSMFRATNKTSHEVLIPTDQWECSVVPGDRIYMTIDIEQFSATDCPSCGCALDELEFPKWFVPPVVRAIDNADCYPVAHATNQYSPCSMTRWA